ncbi:hypothetical protein CDEST_06263 [Colletotrichum destructivum]|uniref:Uncharacterized protein n=1 Tax=Colletotrichum destructivum TaxID=34406 RepID=A0AAX4IE37_9PEZI|nr:hypothetical protein CDEST_06263 [Colletotrichum destructivum]
MAAGGQCGGDDPVGNPVVGIVLSQRGKVEEAHRPGQSLKFRSTRTRIYEGTASLLRGLDKDGRRWRYGDEHGDAWGEGGDGQGREVGGSLTISGWRLLSLG